MDLPSQSVPPNTKGHTGGEAPSDGRYPPDQPRDDLRRNGMDECCSSSRGTVGQWHGELENLPVPEGLLGLPPYKRSRESISRGVRSNPWHEWPHFTGQHFRAVAPYRMGPPHPATGEWPRLPRPSAGPRSPPYRYSPFAKRRTNSSGLSRPGLDRRPSSDGGQPLPGMVVQPPPFPGEGVGFGGNPPPNGGMVKATNCRTCAKNRAGEKNAFGNRSEMRFTA